MKYSISFSAFIVAAISLAPPVTSYCDTPATSKRDCEICKVSLQNATQTECESAGEAPCFWNDSSGLNPYAEWTDAECKNGGGAGGGPPSGGGGKGGGNPNTRKLLRW